MNNMIRLIFIFSVLINSFSVYGCEGDDKFSQFKTNYNYDITGPFTVEEMETDALKSQKEIFEYIKQASKDNPLNKVHYGYKSAEWTELKKEYRTGDRFYSLIRKYGAKISGATILVRGDCILRNISNFSGILELDENIKPNSKLSEYFYTALKVILIIVCIWILLGARLNKKVKTSRKEAEQLLAQSITRRR